MTWRYDPPAGSGSALENIVEDTTPQLGGDLDVNSQDIVSISNGDITIAPDGTGEVILDGLKWPQADGAPDSVLTTNGSGQLVFAAASGGGGDTVTRTNDNAGTLVIGQPVYTKSNGNVDEAQADAAATVLVTGLVVDATIAAAASGDIQIDGILTATTGQWDVVTGKAGGLSVNSNYYLDPDTAGMITDTAPTDASDYVAPIGLALSTTELCLRITPTVLL